jgi:D-beta-D-heptose 7-phosphate kinase/D-beta-D-heptose 1-phosphate adenosyltransferase
MCESIIKYCKEKNIVTFVDPRPEEYEKYKGCFCFKPNIVEARRITTGKIDPISVSKIVELQNILECEHAVVTMGSDGIICDKGETCDIYRPTVVDVTGAGDIVLSIITFFYLYSGNIQKACEIADKIARRSVETFGNYQLSLKDIEQWMDDKTQIVMNNPEKIDEIVHRIKNRKVVFTNGCFDIIHSAHLKLLRHAKNQGDILIVGINSDESVKRLKGEQRPVNDIAERCEVLYHLGVGIDYLLIFDEDTPEELMRKIRPDVLVKGGDYKPEDIPGKELAKEVSIFEYITDKGTSLIIDKCRK